MKYFFVLICIFAGVHLNAQNSIVHIIEINPETKIVKEAIEIVTNVDYLFKIEKDLKGKTVAISPANYQRVEGDVYDFLLFSTPKIEIVYTEKISDDYFKISKSGIHTFSVDFNYNYLSGENLIDYDSTTNNMVSSVIQINDEYEILNYRFNPDILGKSIDGNQVRFKGNVNKMNVEIDYIRKKEIVKTSNTAKEIIVQKEIEFKGTLTLSVWDDVQEDGDIISLWLGEVCLAKNLKVSKDKVNFKITKEMFGSSDVLNIRIDDVDEGTVPPNTVLVELRGEGVHENMRINTTSNMSKEIVLKK